MTPTLFSTGRSVFWRDLTLAARKPADMITPLVFFSIVISLFPLGVSPEPAVLRTLAPGVLWVAAQEGMFVGRPQEDDLMQWRFRPIAVGVPIHGMGCTLLEVHPNGELIIGSFAGLFAWTPKPIFAADVRVASKVPSTRKRATRAALLEPTDEKSPPTTTRPWESIRMSHTEPLRDSG